MCRDSFVLYTHMAQVFKALSNDQKAELITAIFDYEETGKLPVFHDPVVGIAFIPIKQRLDIDAQKYLEVKEAKKRAGAAGADKRWHKMAQDSSAISANSKDSRDSRESQAMAKMPVYVNVNVNENEKDIPEKKYKRKEVRFTQPTLDEVRAYCQERHNSVDPEQFIDFYISKGWMVGKNPMKDWKAAVRTWERQNHNGGRRTQSPMNNSDYLDEILLDEINGGGYEQTGNG